MNEPSIGRKEIVLDGVDVILFPERDDVHEGLAPLHDFWREECRGAVPIPRELVDAVRMPATLLPRFAIVEVLRDPLDFRYRLLGTNLTQFFGRDNTGRKFSEIYYPEPHGENLKNYFAMIANENAIVYREANAAWANRDYVTIASMFMPGTTDGVRTDLIFGAVISIK